MSSRNILSGLLAGLIALSVYYMLHSIFTRGFETNTFVVALIIGAVTFIITIAITYLIRRSRQTGTA